MEWKKKKLKYVPFTIIWICLYVWVCVINIYAKKTNQIKSKLEKGMTPKYKTKTNNDLRWI